MRTPNHQAPVSLDLTPLLEKLGYIKRTKQTKGAGTARYKQFDSRTTSQLQEQRFSGMRANDMWNRFEIWLIGRLHSTLTYAEVFLRPARLNEWYCECFGLDKINLDAKAQRDMQLLEERRAMLSDPEVQRGLQRIEDAGKKKSSK